jgi:signal transduction histidine kinase
LSDIRTSGQTLLAIIDDILDLATIDAGTFELRLAPVKVRRDRGRGAWPAERLKQNRIDLDIRIEPGIDEFVADGFPRVTQILYNLLANAISFSSPGSRSCCPVPTKMPSSPSVEDEGCGIPASIRQPCSTAESRSADLAITAPASVSPS